MSTVLAVHLNPAHTFSKHPQPAVQLIANHGVLGDAHAGALVQHLYLKKRDPTRPNLCQVHLLHAELLDELRTHGFHLAPGELGENITTLNVPLLTLPTDTLLHLGTQVILQVTGLRDPCHQMNKLRPGLMKACIHHSPDGTIHRKSGIMATVHTGGTLYPNDPITITLPAQPHRALGPV